MTRIFRAVTERSIVVQLGLLVVGCQILAHALTILFAVLRFEGPDPARYMSVPALRAGALGELILAAAPDERDVLIRLVERGAAVGVTLHDAPPPSSAERPVNPTAGAMESLFRGLTGRVAYEPDIVATPNAVDPSFLVRIDDRRVMAASSVIEPNRLPMDGILVRLTLLLVVVPLAVGTLWALRSLTAPLGRFAETADRFAIDLDPTPLPVTGSNEMRKLTQAFNTMRARIHDLVESRARMLAAVSHDLRTPLTRIRLRVESERPSDDRARTLKDLRDMDLMIGRSLAYLRDQSAAIKPEVVDLSTVVSTVCDDFSDSDSRVTFVGARSVVVVAEPDMLARALSNIIENALKFGGRAAVSMEAAAPGKVAVVVDDDGPGIPENEKVRAFEPFSRGDRARGADKPGFGLGLAIARQIVERHGGEIELRDRKPHGLSARIILPTARAETLGAMGQPLGGPGLHAFGNAA